MPTLCSSLKEILLFLPTVTWWGKMWKQKWKRCRLVPSLFLPGSLYVCSPTPSTSLPPSRSASVPIEMSNAAVVCEWKRGSLVGTGCPSNLEASALLFSLFGVSHSHFLSRCCVAVKEWVSFHLAMWMGWHRNTRSFSQALATAYTERDCF